MRRFVVLCFAIASAVSAAAACSLLVDTSGFQGEQHPNDGAIDALNNAIADVTTVAAPETSSSTDGGGCDATFCEDFDHEDGLGSKWTAIFVEPPATLAYDTQNPLSPPRSLHITLPARQTDNGPTIDAYVTRTFDAGAGPIRCELSVFVDQPPANAHKDLFQITASGDPGVVDYDLIFALRPDATSVREDISYVDGGCECPRTGKEIETPAVTDGGRSFSRPTSRRSRRSTSTTFSSSEEPQRDSNRRRYRSVSDFGRITSTVRSKLAWTTFSAQ